MHLMRNLRSLRDETPFRRIQTVCLKTLNSLLDRTQLFELINSFLSKLSHKKVSKFSTEKALLMSRRNARFLQFIFILRFKFFKSVKSCITKCLVTALSKGEPNFNVNFMQRVKSCVFKWPSSSLLFSV